MSDTRIATESAPRSAPVAAAARRLSVSIVIPLYNEVENVDALGAELHARDRSFVYSRYVVETLKEP